MENAVIFMGRESLLSILKCSNRWESIPFCIISVCILHFLHIFQHILMISLTKATAFSLFFHVMNCTHLIIIIIMNGSYGKSFILQHVSNDSISRSKPPRGANVVTTKNRTTWYLAEISLAVARYPSEDSVASCFATVKNAQMFRMRRLLGCFQSQLDTARSSSHAKAPCDSAASRKVLMTVPHCPLANAPCM